MAVLCRAASAGLLAALLMACGVEVQRAPEPVPPGRLPAVTPSASGPTAVARGRVWGVRDDRLVPVFAELRGTGPASRVRAVLALSDADRRLSALPPGTRLLQATRSGDAIVLSLSDQARQLPAEDVPLALGQLVFTVTEPSDVERVHVRIEQDPLIYVDASGRRITRALLRSDFVELLQAGATD